MLNRASGQPASRATERLLMGTKPVEHCGCDEVQDLQRRINTMRPFVESAIVKLVEIASSPESAAAGPLLDLRKALSALDSGDE